MAANDRAGSDGSVVNLRSVRKQVLREQDRQTAASNRLASGESKALRQLAKAREDKRRREFDAHRIEAEKDDRGTS